MIIKEAMTALLSPELEPPHYNGKITTYVTISCMLAATGGILMGYDVGISGGVTSMEPFLKSFFPSVLARLREGSTTSNYCMFDDHILTAFTSSLYIAGLIASFWASTITRKFGHRTTIIAGGAAFFTGSVVGGVAVNVYMLILARGLLGVGVGFATQAVPLYLSEMAPPHHRGAFNNGFQFSTGIGFIFANAINFGTQKIEGGWGWRLSLALGAVPACLLMFGAIFLPDTPNSIIQCTNDTDKAKKVLQSIRGTTDVHAELSDIIEACTAANSVKNPFRSIIKRQRRPQLIMAIAIPFLQQVTGFNLIAFYAPVLFRTIGLRESASLMTGVVVGLIGSVANFLSMFIVDRLGRRPLFMAGGVQMLVTQLLIGGVLAAEFKDHGEMSAGYAYLVLALVCIYIMAFEWSWGPLAWLVPSEIFPLEMRSAGQSISVAVNFIFSFIIAQTLMAMLCQLKFGVFFFFGGWVAAMTLFVYLFLPETKSLPIEQMDQVWRKHWFWKKMVN